jgi:hypothetical protein
MGDSYKHNVEGISSIISSLQVLINDYKDSILELINLVDSINGSTSWIDQDVKGTFINTCNSYVSFYKDLVNSMENYVNYLIRKSDSASAIESAYSRG